MSNLLHDFLNGRIEEKPPLTFEIPSNLDINLIKILSLLQIPDDTINCIYVPSRIKDSFSTQRDFGSDPSKMDDKSYDNYLTLLQDNFPNKTQILMQGGQFIENDNIKYYADHGITKYCVGTLYHAQKLKEFNPNFEITMSITMGVEPKQLIEHPEYEELFDQYVLPFRANRDPKIIDLVPSHYKRILIPNNFCHPLCPGIYHWSYKQEYGDLLEYICYRNHYDMSAITTIAPWDLATFREKIDIFKLVDRGNDTWKIIRNLAIYSDELFWEDLSSELTPVHDLSFYQRY